MENQDPRKSDGTIGGDVRKIKAHAEDAVVAFLDVVIDLVDRISATLRNWRQR